MTISFAGSPIIAGTSSEKPVATGNTGIIYLETNTSAIYYSDGNSWITILSSQTSPMLNGIRINSTEVTADTTLTDWHWRLRANALNNSLIITVPTAVGNTGKNYSVRKTDTSFNIVTVQPSNNELIGGANNWELRNPNDEVEFISDGTKWNVMGYSSYDYNGYRRIGATSPSRYYVAGMDSQTAFGTPAVVTANQLYALPFFVGRGGVIDQVGVNVTAGVAASNVRMGVYRNINGIPGTLISDLGTVATTTPAALKTINTNLRMQPGLYWLASVFSHAPTVRVISQTAISPLFGVDNAAVTGIGTAYTSAFTYAALPSTFPAITVSVASTQPALFYHFSE